jgi:hypothetical protein
MTDVSEGEYASLRATIQARGTARPLAFLAGISTWAALQSAVLIWLPNPIGASMPLIVLLATFEVIRSLHLGIERIGRYLQVFYEESASAEAPLAPPAWERTAMTFGPAIPGAGGHPFFFPIFLIATFVNFLAVVLPSPVLVAGVTMAVPHLAFIIWMVYCERGMRRQRETELARYRVLKKDSGLRPSLDSLRS